MPRSNPAGRRGVIDIDARGRRTEKLIATVQAAGEEDVDSAVKAARAALKHESWKELPASERGALMYKLADLMEQKRELFATIDAWDNGGSRPSLDLPSIGIIGTLNQAS